MTAAWRVLLEVGTERFAIRTDRPLHVGLPLDFHGDQPEAFGLPRAAASVCRTETFVGDTRQGGSCNCETVTLTPHANGTHTEGIGHLTEQRVSVHAALRDALMPATVVSLRPEPAEHGPAITAGVVARASLQPGPFVHALVVRTRPNYPDKKTRSWWGSGAPYFAPDAIAALTGLGVRHLVCDLPSLDPERDGGALAAHRAFWAMGDRRVNPDTRGRTVTERAYIDDSIADGRYLLELQVAPFVLDAAPSRPILYALDPIEEMP